MVRVKGRGGGGGWGEFKYEEKILGGQGISMKE